MGAKPECGSLKHIMAKVGSKKDNQKWQRPGKSGGHML